MQRHARVSRHRLRVIRVRQVDLAEQVLDLFKVRRCQIKIRRDPSFPGCIYSEMKMCLAPCFKGCSDDEYHAEVARVQQYFDSAGESLLRDTSLQRDQASSNLEFENAATLHARVGKLKPVLSQLPEIVRRIDQLAAVMVQPSALPDSVTFFRIDAGLITGTPSRVGQFIPSMSLNQFAGAGQTLSLQQVTQSSASRTNLGLIESTGNPVTLLATAFGNSNFVTVALDDNPWFGPNEREPPRPVIFFSRLEEETVAAAIELLNG